MSDYSDTATQNEPEAPDPPKDRECLRCRVTFLSSWAGERICSRCRSSNAWKKGAPLPSYSAGGRS